MWTNCLLSVLNRHVFLAGNRKQSQHVVLLISFNVENYSRKRQKNTYKMNFSSHSTSKVGTKKDDKYEYTYTLYAYYILYICYILHVDITKATSNLGTMKDNKYEYTYTLYVYY